MVVVQRVARTSSLDHRLRDVRPHPFVGTSISKLQGSYILVEWQRWVTPTISQVPVSYLIPINLDILIFACLFELFLSLDAIHHKNNILLFAVCICNACSFGYSVMQFLVMRDTTARLFESRFNYPTLVDTTRNVWPQLQPAEILVCIFTGLCTLFLCPIAYLIHRDYSWAIYKSVHGSLDTRMRYLAYEVTSTPSCSPFS